MNILKIIHEKSQPNLVRANFLLLSLMAAMLVVVAFLPDNLQDYLNKALITAIFFSSVYALAYRSRILLPVAILLTLVQWISKITNITSLDMISGMLSVIFFIYVAIRLIRQFAGAKKVSQLVILGSINGYLLLGFVFSILTVIVCSIYPESYYSAHLHEHLTAKTNFHTYIYYTYITMATVGYGDIVPVSAAARALAVLIAVSGQLYIAVVIAFLVGKFAGMQHPGNV